MIIVTKGQGTIKDVVDMFDTAEEFKKHVDNYCEEMEKGLRQDGLLEKEGYLFGCPLNNVPFNDKLLQYLNQDDGLTLSFK